MPRLTGQSPVPFGNEDDGFLIQVSSATSSLDVEFAGLDDLIGIAGSGEGKSEGAFQLAEILGSEFDILGRRYFLFRGVEPADDGLEDTLASARVHVSIYNFERAGVVPGPSILLILDHVSGAIVDWVNHSVETDSAWTFDLPLVPANPELMAENRDSLIDVCSDWNDESSLFCCIVGLPELRPGRWPDHDIPLEPGDYYWPGVLQLDKGFAEWVDKKIKAREELQRIDEHGTPVDDAEGNLAAYDGRVLLFCHGIFSSTDGAFGDLFQNSSFLRDMRRTYSNQVLAWDHWTLSKSTNRNAHDLADRIRGLRDVELDVICHSRGAGVMRNFFEDPTLRAYLDDNQIKVRTCVYVAGACLGSQLAMPNHLKRLFRRITLLTWLLGGFGTISGPIIAAIKALAMGVQNFPGVLAMDPVGTDMHTLNSYGKTVAKKYTFIRANYEARFWPLKLAEEIFWDKPIFGGLANDLIVPYYGASRTNAYLPKSPVWRENIGKFGTEKKGQSKVRHTNFFAKRRTRNAIRRELGIH